MLDQPELQQLAINASTAGDSASAIAYLKEAVARPDATAIAHYLLGAEYAQIGMYERAIGEMEAAIALDPALSIARLQLGLLWLGANDNTRAADVLLPLTELADGQPLHHFGAGLLHLIKQEAADAVRCLKAGIALNSVNPPLNADMQKIVQQLEQAPPDAADAAPAAAADDGQHILLSAYTGQRH
jgi:tetratricopeptide (TPR) repeat protein